MNQCFFTIGQPAFEQLCGLVKNGAISLAYISKAFDVNYTEPLLKIINNPDSNVRAGSILILGAIKDARAVEPIIKALKDDNIEVRNAAALALKSYNVQMVHNEKEIIIQREILKIYCKWCGTKIDATCNKCPNCGGPV